MIDNNSNKPTIRIARSTARKAKWAVWKSLLITALFSALLILVVFSATLGRLIFSSSGVYLVKNNTFPGGVIPTGTKVLTTGGAVNNFTMSDNLYNAFTWHGDTLKGEVLAGPYGKFISLDKKALIGKAQVDCANCKEEGEIYLNKQYLILNQGKLHQVNQDNILGIIKE